MSMLLKAAIIFMNYIITYYVNLVQYTVVN